MSQNATATTMASNQTPWGHFAYRNGALSCGNLPFADIAAEYGTPCFVYDGDCIVANYHRISAHLALIPHCLAYAVKANAMPALLRLLAAAGAGADIVSRGELELALRAGFPAERIVFSGVGKRDDELIAAMDAGVRSVHIESLAELAVLEALAKQRNGTAAVALRVNPDVDAATHPYIATGLHSSKFGLDFSSARQALALIRQSASLRLEGLTCHIGSLIDSPTPLRLALRGIAELARECLAEGMRLKRLDAGGGWGVNYGGDSDPPPPLELYARALVEEMREANLPELELWVELGRSLVANAGALLARTLYIKETQRLPRRIFTIVDAGMSELIRPPLYRGYHTIAPWEQRLEARVHRKTQVVGPICESGDFLAQDRLLPSFQRGDGLAVLGAGAYAAVMASRYNGRPRPPEILVRNGLVAGVQPREDLSVLWDS